MDIHNFKKRKKLLGMTTAQVADMAQLPLSTVSKIMTGETQNASYMTIEILEEAISREEQYQRLMAYFRAFAEYAAEHGEEVSSEQFEEIYRQQHNLNDAPIPFAVPRDSDLYMEGNLAFRPDERISVDALARFPESRWMELVDGQLFVDHAPGLSHQDLVQDISAAIRDYIRGNQGGCRVYDTGVNVFLDQDDYTLVIPDIAVICDSSRLQEQGIWGPPDWIIEVTSPSTRTRDYKLKLHKYMAAGVREYWIVDLQNSRVTVNINGEPMLVHLYSFGDEIPVGIYENKLKMLN